MPTWSRRERVVRSRERGAAVVEFIGVVVMLMVPVAYALATLLQLHVQTATARTAAVATALAIARGEHAGVAHRIAGRSWVDGAPRELGAEVRCAPSCRAPGGIVTVQVTVGVPVPVLGTTMTVRQQGQQVVDRFAAR